MSGSANNLKTPSFQRFLNPAPDSLTDEKEEATATMSESASRSNERCIPYPNCMAAIMVESVVMQIQQTKQWEQEKIDKLIGKSGIKKRFQTRTFENWKVTDNNRKAYETAKDYADNFAKYAEEGSGLYFEGTYGTGKTHLAAAIAMQLMRSGVSCICRSSIDMYGDIKNTYNSGENITEQQVLRVYKEVGLLVIDDLGKELCTDWTLATLYDILNDRYEDMRPTIITTNHNDKALITRMTPKGYNSTNIKALVSRIKGCSQVVTMVWDDYRTGGNNAN